MGKIKISLHLWFQVRTRVSLLKAPGVQQFVIFINEKLKIMAPMKSKII